MKKIFLIGLIFLTGCQGQQIGAVSPLKTTMDKVVLDKQVTDWRCDEPGRNCIDNGLMVKYLYVTDVERPVERYKGYDEKLERRTSSQQFFDTGDGTEIGKLYVEDLFHYDSSEDVWYELDEATTTLKKFDEELAKIGGRRFGATCESGDTCPAGAGDGHIYRDNGGDAGWSDTHDAATGTNAAPTGANMNAYWYYYGARYALYRTMVPVNSSGILVSQEVLSAEFKAYSNGSVHDVNNTNDYIVIVQTTQPDHTTLTAADFNNFTVDGGGWLEVSDTLSLNIPTGQYNTWTITDLSVIKRNSESSTCGTDTALTGWTCLGMMIGDDSADTDPGATGGGQDNGEWSQTAGEANPAFLEVVLGAAVTDTCTAPATGDWNVQMNDNCFVSLDTYIQGQCNLLSDQGTGGLNIIDGALLSCHDMLHGTTTQINMEKGTQLDKDNQGG